MNLLLPPQDNKLCNAYYYVGDPEFPRLAQLFGPTTVKKEGHDVVIVSDNTTANHGPTMHLTKAVHWLRRHK